MDRDTLYNLIEYHIWFTDGRGNQYRKLFDLADSGAPIKDLALAIWMCSDFVSFSAIEIELGRATKVGEPMDIIVPEYSRFPPAAKDGQNIYWLSRAQLDCIRPAIYEKMHLLAQESGDMEPGWEICQLEIDILSRITDVLEGVIPAEKCYSISVGGRELIGVKGLPALRQLRGLTQKALADAANCHIRQIQKYESGEYAPRNMSFALAAAIAQALGLSLDALHDALKGGDQDDL